MAQSKGDMEASTLEYFCRKYILGLKLDLRTVN